MVLMKREALMESPSWITLVRGFVSVVRSRLTSARASATGTGYTCHHHHVLSDKIESKKFVYLFHPSTLTHMKFYTKPSHTWTVSRLGCAIPGLSYSWTVGDCPPHGLPRTWTVSHLDGLDLRAVLCTHGVAHADVDGVAVVLLAQTLGQRHLGNDTAVRLRGLHGGDLNFYHRRVVRRCKSRNNNITSHRNNNNTSHKNNNTSHRNLCIQVEKQLLSPLTQVDASELKIKHGTKSCIPNGRLTWIITWSHPRTEVYPQRSVQRQWDVKEKKKDRRRGGKGGLTVEGVEIDSSLLVPPASAVDGEDLFGWHRGVLGPHGAPAPRGRGVEGQHGGRPPRLTPARHEALGLEHDGRSVGLVQAGQDGELLRLESCKEAACDTCEDVFEGETQKHLLGKQMKFKIWCLGLIIYLSFNCYHWFMSFFSFVLFIIFFFLYKYMHADGVTIYILSLSMYIYILCERERKSEYPFLDISSLKYYSILVQRLPSLCNF